jgi:hypothetical protein
MKQEGEVKRVTELKNQTVEDAVSRKIWRKANDNWNTLLDT